MQNNIILYRLKRVFHFFKTGLWQGLRGQLAFGFPQRQLKIIVITGTDGKTTSASLLHHVLTKAGRKAGLLTTVAAYIGDQKIDTGLHVTSPNPFNLYRILRQMADAGMEYVVLEVTSHGAYQWRDWGIRPLAAGLTNITHEHLDYHLNYDLYVEAKALILAKAKRVYLNADDHSSGRLRRLLGNNKKSWYSVEDRLYWKVLGAIKNRFPEAHNQMNARLVYAITSDLGIENQTFESAMDDFAGVPGRMQIVATKPYTVVVDFAHTPNGLQHTLMALRQQLKKQKKAGRLIAVYGCAGLRDFAKRPRMGKIGVELADLVVFTAEDPRTESVWSIIRQMKEQLATGHSKISSVADRKQAIEFALTKLAQPGDIVAVLGKGHEQSMNYGGVEYPWDEVAVIREFLS